MSQDEEGSAGEVGALHRNLRLFHLYRFLSTSYLFIPVLYLQSRGLSFTQIGLLSSVYCVTVMIFEVPTGALADHFGRRLAMSLGSLLMAAGCLVDYLGRSFPMFAFGDGMLALGMTLASGADSAYLFDLLRDHGEEHHYRRLEGSASSAKLVGTSLGLVLGGWVARHDLALTYLLTGGVCLVSAGIAALLHERRPEGGLSWEVRRALPGSSPWLWPLMRSSLREILRRAELRAAIAFSILVFTLLREGMYLHPIYLRQAHFGVDWIGMCLAALTLFSAWSAHRIEEIRALFGERRLLWFLPLLLSVSYLCMGVWFTGFGVGFLLCQMLVNGVYSPLSKELLNREINDSRQRATVLSMESMARRLVFGITSPLIGLGMDRYGIPLGFFGSGALGLLGAALYAWQFFTSSRRSAERATLLPAPVTLPSDAGSGASPAGHPSPWRARSPRG